MGQLCGPERDLIKVTEQQERQHSRMEHLYLLWILRNLAWILMLLSGIAGYHLYRMLRHS